MHRTNRPISLTNSPLTKGMLQLSSIMDFSLTRAMAFQWTNHLALIITNSPLFKGILRLSSIERSSLAGAMAFQWTRYLTLIIASLLQSKCMLMVRAIMQPT
jgi:hypothetical protein